MYPLSYYYKKKIPLSERGRDQYKLADIVSWYSRVGRIVEVVPYGMYPIKQPRLRVRGYYREHESYVVEDEKGKRYWPRVGTLKLEKRDE